MRRHFALWPTQDNNICVSSPLQLPLQGPRGQADGELLLQGLQQLLLLQRQSILQQEQFSTAGPATGSSDCLQPQVWSFSDFSLHDYLYIYSISYCTVFPFLFPFGYWLYFIVGSLRSHGFNRKHCAI